MRQWTNILLASLFEKAKIGIFELGGAVILGSLEKTGSADFRQCLVQSFGDETLLKVPLLFFSTLPIITKPQEDF
jgi:hypothetical protein